MAGISEDMRELLESVKPWVLATVDSNGVPHAVPIGTVAVLNDATLLFGALFMNKTLDNIKANPNAAVSVWKGAKGYQFKGRAVVEESGPDFEAASNLVKKGKIKAAVVFNIDSIYNITPGPDAGKKIE